MPESTIKDVTEAKKKLELKESISDFEDKHEVSVDDVRIIQADVLGKRLPEVTGVEVDLKL